MESRTLEITAKNGIKYQFVEFRLFGISVNAYSWFRDRWNRLSISFNSLAEAEEWVNQLNEKYEAQKNERRFESKMPQSAYYSMTGYYGD